MKLQIMSDLHLDHYAGDSFRPECEDEANTVLVLAGDIIGLTQRCHKTAVAFFTDVCARYKRVVYVTGNHEYYGTSWEGAHWERTKLELACCLPGKELVMAEDFAMVTIDGQRLLLGTMWIPEPAPGTPNITDAQAITRYKPRVFTNHRTFCEAMDAWLQPTDIVVTHHLPSNESVAPQYCGDIYNAWFVAPDMEDKIRKVQPKLWVHGHTHNSFDYFLGRTRVICNPRGYPNEMAKSGQEATFNPNLVVEIQ